MTAPNRCTGAAWRFIIIEYGSLLELPDHYSIPILFPGLRKDPSDASR